jgi:hypothetical protein
VIFRVEKFEVRVVILPSAFEAGGARAVGHDAEFMRVLKYDPSARGDGYQYVSAEE